MATFVVAHGAWSAGFVWKKMPSLLRVHGHEIYAPSYTGLGDRVHLLNGWVSLETHIEDIVQVLFHEDLHDVYLIGHSYGGMVATGVADRVPERLKAIVYLDAFIPRDGDSMESLAIPEQRERWLTAAKEKGDGWRVPSNPLPPDTSEADVAWITPRRHDHPLKAIQAPLKLKNGETKLPRAYIYCTRTAPGNMFGPFAERARTEPGWIYHELYASHSPHVTAPDGLADVLERIVAQVNGGTPK